MLLLNFSHPLLDEHLAQIEALAGEPVQRVIEVPSPFDHGQPFVEQVAALVARCGLTPTEWQTARLVVNPPAYNFAAVTLLAYLHGLMGYFPTILRMRPVAGSTPPRFEMAELINLQAAREAGRAGRQA